MGGCHIEGGKVIVPWSADLGLAPIDLNFGRGAILWAKVPILVSRPFSYSVASAGGSFDPYELDSHTLIGRHILPWIIGVCNLHFRLISNLHIF